MNRADFMRQLESLLSDISSTEREEALQYYNDYFDDAGPENEQRVIEALGNPARVAESIRRDLLGSGYGDSAAREVTRQDRALMKYGEAPEAEGAREAEDVWESAASSVLPPVPASASKARDGAAKDRSGWLLLATATLAVIVFPCLLNVAAALFGLLVGWFALILGFGVAAAVLFIFMVILVVGGIRGLFLAPLGGAGLIGCGLLCGGLALLFLVLVLLMAGVATPALWRWLVSPFRRIVRKCKSYF